MKPIPRLFQGSFFVHSVWAQEIKCINGEEAAGDVRFCIARQKPHKNREKQRFRTIFPKVSEWIRTHPDPSERIQTHPNNVRSRQVPASLKTSKTSQKLAKTLKVLRFVCEIFTKACFAIPWLRQRSLTSLGTNLRWSGGTWSSRHSDSDAIFVWSGGGFAGRSGAVNSGIRNFFEN